MRLQEDNEAQKMPRTEAVCRATRVYDSVTSQSNSKTQMPNGNLINMTEFI